jgi:hypothetical protein
MPYVFLPFCLAANLPAGRQERSQNTVCLWLKDKAVFLLPKNELC